MKNQEKKLKNNEADMKNKETDVKTNKKEGISQKKIQANQKNAMHGTGPTSEAGKLLSRMNALKHGIFARELKVSDEEKPEYELLYRALYVDLAPNSILQQIGFERVAWFCWRWKLTLRLEMKQLKARLEFNENEQPQTDAPTESVLPTSWYGASNGELRAGLTFLSSLLQDVEANGRIHADDWKDRVIKAFGQKFYDSLTEWVPMNIATIQVAEMLSAHAANFNMPLPSTIAPDLKNDRTTVDPRLNWQMGTKLIDLMRQHLEGLLRMNKLGTDGHDQGQGAATLDLASRYVTTATRDLERAVKWYMDLKTQGR